jgi:hypothetical protein
VQAIENDAPILLATVFLQNKGICALASVVHMLEAIVSSQSDLAVFIISEFRSTSFVEYFARLIHRQVGHILESPTCMTAARWLNVGLLTQVIHCWSKSQEGDKKYAQYE